MPKIRKSNTVRNRRVGQGKSGIVYSRYLNASGQPAMNPAMASYLVTVHEPSSLSTTQIEYEARSLRLGGNHWCHGTINPHYIADQVNRASYIIKLEALNSRTGATMQLGFASTINQGQGVLYIDLICARVTDLVRAAAGLGKNSAGGLLMKQIVAFAQQPQFGFTQLKLSALPYVIGFYDKLGFRLDTPDTPQVREITNNLRTFRFRSSDEFNIAYKMSKMVMDVQPPNEFRQPLSDEQIKNLTKLTENYQQTLKRRRPGTDLSKMVIRYYHEAVDDPKRIRSLHSDIFAIKQLGLAPDGIPNGIRMVYDVPQAQGGSATNRSRKTRRAKHTRRRRRSPARRSHTMRKSG